MAALSHTCRSNDADVFISFVGKDTGNNFTGFLHRDLKRHRIGVFMSGQDGIEIGFESLKMIEKCKMAIVVFSKHYAHSRSRLEELVEIVQRSWSGKLMILPIYIGVHPSDVRNQTGSFEHSFQEHERNFDPHIVERWRKALREAGSLRGFDLSQENGDESRLVELVVDSTLEILDTNTRFKSYDVFLSFRGGDTRNNFTGFLYRELKRVGINVFMDNEALWVGGQIESYLYWAIRKSEISIVVFSENYADSKWCLTELADIVKSHRSDGQKILPIFFNVNPSDVRDLTGNVEASFQKLRDKYPKKIDSWKDALKVVGQKKGIELRQVNGNQSDLVDIVVGLVLRELYRNNSLY